MNKQARAQQKQVLVQIQNSCTIGQKKRKTLKFDQLHAHIECKLNGKVKVQAWIKAGQDADPQVLGKVFTIDRMKLFKSILKYLVLNSFIIQCENENPQIFFITLFLKSISFCLNELLGISLFCQFLAIQLLTDLKDSLRNSFTEHHLYSPIQSPAFSIPQSLFILLFSSFHHGPWANLLLSRYQN